MRFAYRARDFGGQVVEGEIEAESDLQAASTLRGRGLVLVGLRPVAAAASRAERPLAGSPDTGHGGRTSSPAARAPVPQAAQARSRPGALSRPLPLRQLAHFCRQFGTLIASGVPILRALEVMIEQADSPALQRVLRGVSGELAAGRPLAAAMEAQGAAFPPLMIGLVTAGETGGVLDSVLDRLATQLEKDYALQQKVRTSLFYPITVASLAAVVVVVMVVFVLPNILLLFSDLGARLPWPTRALLWLSNVMRQRWWAVLLALLLPVLGLGSWFRTPRGRRQRDVWRLRLPVFGQLLRLQAMARFGRTLGSLLGGGVPVLVALEVVSRTLDNRRLEETLASVADEVRRGGSLAPPLRRDRLFPALIVEMVAIGEETGRVDQLLLRVGDFYEAETDRVAGRLSALLEPIIIAGLGVVVAFILLAIVMPLFDAWGQIR